MYAMDALFGLPRKKSAGVSHREPLHHNLFFQPQLEVDQYVAGNSHSKATDDSVRDMYLRCIQACHAVFQLTPFFSLNVFRQFAIIF